MHKFPVVYFVPFVFLTNLIVCEKMHVLNVTEGYRIFSFFFFGPCRMLTHGSFFVLD